ncbi:uncharacterized protein LOC115728741 [Rhodamnia argentea]|uniref:Uncharacterized protein LOC115728741 n=1 Tax=Rhodamnia argentea TaxID=178133 RepID=A0A8B8MXV4_9MYRT|nr:uncharacterized protein LOC115728741 [Rhodamnia argentea]
MLTSPGMLSTIHAEMSSGVIVSTIVSLMHSSRLRPWSNVPFTWKSGLWQDAHCWCCSSRLFSSIHISERAELLNKYIGTSKQALALVSDVDLDAIAPNLIIIHGSSGYAFRCTAASRESNKLGKKPVITDSLLKLVASKASLSISDAEKIQLGILIAVY